MLKEKLGGINLSELIDRAEEVFEKKSGWKHKDVKETLNSFRGLDRVNQVLLGGLLVGQALLGKKEGGTAVETKSEAKPARRS